MRKVSRWILLCAFAAIPLTASAANFDSLFKGPSPEEPSEPGLSSSTDGVDPPDTLALDTDAHYRMMVDVNIGDKGPYSFVIDTGAERTVIAQEVAAQLALKSGTPIDLHSMGSMVRAQTVVIPRLSVNQLQVRRIQAPALEQRHIGAAGILGIDALQSKNVLMDFKVKTMTLTNSGEDAAWGGDVVVVRAYKKFGQLVLTNAMLNSEPVEVILDTGGQVSIGNEALRRRLATGSSIDPMRTIDIVSVTGEKTQADYTTVRRLTISSLIFRNLPLAFADAHLFKVLGLADKPAMTLGMDALRKFDRVSVDFRARKVRFNLSRDVQPASAEKIQ